MYNIDFLPQLEASRRHIFGSGDPRELGMRNHYSIPLGVEVLECVEDINGEWVPKRALDDQISS